MYKIAQFKITDKQNLLTLTQILSIKKKQKKKSNNVCSSFFQTASDVPFKSVCYLFRPTWNSSPSLAGSIQLYVIIGRAALCLHPPQGGALHPPPGVRYILATITDTGGDTRKRCESFPGIILSQMNRYIVLLCLVTSHYY